MMMMMMHDAPDEVRLCRVQRVHQGGELHQVDRGHRLPSAALLLLSLCLLFLKKTFSFGSKKILMFVSHRCSGGLARMVEPKMNKKLVGACRLENLDHSVVDRVLVLLQPTGDVVRDDAGIVGDGEVSILVSLGLRLQEDGKLAKGGLQLLLKGLVGGLGEEGLLLEDCPESHGLLEHDDGRLEVHPKVNHHPVDAFPHVFFLFHHKPTIKV